MKHAVILFGWPPCVETVVGTHNSKFGTLVSRQECGIMALSCVAFLLWMNPFMQLTCNENNLCVMCNRDLLAANFIVYRRGKMGFHTLQC